MKIFISWSGERSHRVAQLLDEWIQCVIQAVDPWLSSKDIDRGSLWFTDVSGALAGTNNGIICLTKSNKDKPWILFEAGAIAKGLNYSRVFTFLIDLKPSDIKDPLAQFNHTEPTRDSLYQLIRSINNALGEKALRENIISNVFDTYYPQFEEAFKKIIVETQAEEVIEERPKDEILSDILEAVRGMDKRLRNVEETKKIDTTKDFPVDYNLTHRISHLLKMGKSKNEIQGSLGLFYDREEIETAMTVAKALNDFTQLSQ